jgi:hypothetical protein
MMDYQSRVSEAVKADKKRNKEDEQDFRESFFEALRKVKEEADGKGEVPTTFNQKGLAEFVHDFQRQWQRGLGRQRAVDTSASLEGLLVGPTQTARLDELQDALAAEAGEGQSAEDAAEEVGEDAEMVESEEDADEGAEQAEMGGGDEHAGE